MPTSTYFNFYKSKPEQRLIEDLMVEAIKQYGFDGYYIPMENTVARDLLFGDDPLKEFTSAYPLEFYMSSSEGYIGEQEFFSKFGLEIHNTLTLMMSKRSFAQRLPQSEFTRPREGDLIYIPFSGASGQGELMEIKFVQGNKDFYVLGRKSPYFYEVQLEKFKYSQELVDTGVAEIDIISEDAYTLTFDINVNSGTGDYLHKEIVYQGTDEANATATGVVSSWARTNPKSNTATLSVTNIKGNFAGSTRTYGVTSNANYVVLTFDPITDSQHRDVYDNKIIQNEANSVVNFSETNPFGVNI
jgi:hypothetical protein